MTVNGVPPVAVPPAVVTAIKTAPGFSFGTVAVIRVPAASTVKLALLPPNITAVAPTKLVPVIVTEDPAGPLIGATRAIAGDRDRGSGGTTGGRKARDRRFGADQLKRPTSQSQPAPCGRATPRWSAAIGSPTMLVQGVGIWSTAALVESSPIVQVGPPLSWRPAGSRPAGGFVTSAEVLDHHQVVDR